jgi:hypothetical protein
MQLFAIHAKTNPPTITALILIFLTSSLLDWTTTLDLEPELNKMKMKMQRKRKKEVVCRKLDNDKIIVI